MVDGVSNNFTGVETGCTMDVVVQVLRHSDHNLHHSIIVSKVIKLNYS